MASQMIAEVTAHAQSDSLEDAREICANDTYFPNNLLIIRLYHDARSCECQIIQILRCRKHSVELNNNSIQYKVYMFCILILNNSLYEILINCNSCTSLDWP